MPSTVPTKPAKSTAREPTSGLCGATNSAKTARKPSTRRIAIGTIGTPSVRKAASRQATVSPAARLGAGALTLISNPRVDHGIENVHHHVDDDDHGAAQH